MKCALRCVLWSAVLLLIAPAAMAQCGAHLLAALDEENPLHAYQTFDASVWTNSPYCPASGQISISTMPPGMILFPSGDPWWVESFFDVFTEPQTTKPEVVPTGMPESFFDIFTEVTFDDPAYPPLTYVEHARITPLNRLEIVRTIPCTDLVPSVMSNGLSYCFKVCHRIYTIPLVTAPSMGQPIITVTPGCTGSPGDNCVLTACTPGDMNSYRSEVYQSGGQWYLEFEYSNPAMEPVCYCVRYDGNLPLGGETYTLGGWENERQTMDVSVWTNNTIHPLNGTIEVFSYPSGVQLEGGGGGGGHRIDSFFDVFMEPFTFDPPAGAGSFTPGETFQLIGYIHYDPPGPVYPPEWVVEDVVVTLSGGIQLLNPGCTGPVTIPSVINPGIPECMIVCHDVYHIPLNCPPASVPTVTIYSGCDATTPCNSAITCTPGAMTDFRSDVFRIGGTWILEFEYSNPQNQPVCYCVDVSCAPVTAPPAFVLGAINPISQTFDVSAWGSSAATPLNGQIMVHSDPPGALIDFPAESFFDIFLEPFTAKIPVGPGIFTPGQVFELVAEIDYFGPGSDPFDGCQVVENVIVTPANTLALWDPNSPCTGDWVPASMVPGESECFKVCHRVYETILYYNYGGGRPAVHVIPGCTGLNCAAEACVPGGPNDFVATVYHNGVDWVLRFEYSNPYIEPVCYCVTYTGNVPWDCDTRELAALDEGHMNFDVSLRTVSAGGYDCPTSGQIQVFSYPAGAFIGPYTGSFVSDGIDWYTLSVPVGPGSFGAGQAFQLIAYYDYTDPEYPDRWVTEDVIVEPSGLYLWINDVGGECAAGGYEVVPTSMALGQTECFKVCHRIYHIALAATDPLVQPQVIVTSGCVGPPQDLCVPDPTCTPGGDFDYRYLVWWAGDHWELEFEYSNENVEPVCYCVSVAAPLPPGQTHELVGMDDLTSMLDVTTWATGLTDPFESIAGQITVSSQPAGAYIGPYTGTFSGVAEDWYTIEVPVGAGSFGPGSTFEFVVLYEYTVPDFPDVVKNEWVQVLPDGELSFFDQGGECSGDNVPSSMALDQSACFKVCHRIYHISLAATDSASKPRLEIEYGCDGMPPGCTLDVNCLPGEQSDYRYSIVWVGDHWELEFEYSNPNIEPVCYCITVLPAICQPAFDLVIQPVDTNRIGVREPNVRLSWTCPQWGRYTIYSTTDKNNNGSPPGPGWVVEDQVYGSTGERKFWYGNIFTNDYKNYVVKCDCDPPSRR